MDIHTLTIRTITFNNEAVRLMSIGEYGTAISKFSRALHFSKDTMAQVHGECASRLPLHLTLNQSISQQTIAASPPRQGGQEMLSGDEQQPAAVFIYERPIWINSDDDKGYLRLDYEASVLNSVILIFNLALAYHLSAASSCDRDGPRDTSNSKSKGKSNNIRCGSSNTMLKKAVKLYELAFKMVREEDLEDSSFFSMACINNIALIYRDYFHDNVTAEKCWQYLLSTLMFLVDCSDGGEEQGKNSHQMEGYLRNTSHLVVRQTSAAAA